MNNITGDSIGKLVYNSISRSVIEKGQYSLELSSWFFVRDFVLNPVEDSVEDSVRASVYNKMKEYEFRRRY